MIEEMADQCRSFSDEVHELSVHGCEEKHGQCWLFPCQVEQVQARLVWDAGQLQTGWYQGKKPPEFGVKPMLEELWPGIWCALDHRKEPNVLKDFTVTFHPYN